MDNFDLKKFLKDSKALENLNPTIKSLNENETLKDKIREMIIAELDSKDPYDKNPDDSPYEEEDGKSYYPHLQDLILDPNKEEEPEDDPEEDEAERRDYNKFFQSLKDKIREMIIAELETVEEETDIDLMDPVKEAKKKKDKDIEDVEDVEVTDTEDISLDDIPTSEETPEPSTGGGLEDIAADMKGTEADLMDHLMKSFQIAKGMNNEKLETQVGNTLKFFVSEYIGGGED